MTQKEKLEILTGEKFPDPTPQEIQKEQIEGTPFWIISKENEHNLVMGHYILNSQPFYTKSELIQWMEQHRWNIQLSMTICTVTDMLNKAQYPVTPQTK